MFFIPPYACMGGGYLVYCVFVCLSFCMYGYGFLSGGKGSCMKLCMVVRLLSAMSFSHFGELWLEGSHGGGITSGIYTATNWMQAAAPSEARWGFGIGCRCSVGSQNWGRRRCLRPYGGIYVLQACWRTFPHLLLFFTFYLFPFLIRFIYFLILSIPSLFLLECPTAIPGRRS